MRLIFEKNAWDDYLYWQAHDRKIVLRINALIKECIRTPYSGAGNPEPLRNQLSGYWSRRIAPEHRLVYRLSNDDLLIAQCRHHYERG